ncbi:MAG: histidine kinase [Verrucomicrobiales bacterium]
MAIFTPLPRLSCYLCRITLLWVAGICAAQAASPEVSGIVRFLSGSVRDIEADLEQISEEIKTLPAMPTGPKGGSLGYHDRTLDATYISHKSWVQIDLGRPLPVDAIALVPVNLPLGFGDNRSYGFPAGFQVDISIDPDFVESSVVADYTAGYPFDPRPAVLIDARHQTGRYLRITATRHWSSPTNNRAVFALGELMVFCNGRNIAPGKSVTASDSIEGHPEWGMDNLVDGQSAIGHATKSEPSKTNGYHSEIEDTALRSKWVQIDLGSVEEIEEVRVFPARPVDWAESHGFGFPLCFKVEASESPDFSEPVMLLDRTGERQTNPGDNTIVIPLDGLHARHVRFTATHLWKRDNDYVFALSEMQVFSKGLNIALHRNVTASDSLQVGRWSSAFLVDGYDSQNAIEDGEFDWLSNVIRKQRLIEKSRELEEKLAQTSARVTTRLIAAVSGIFFVFAVFVVISIIRSRMKQAREIQRIRGRIARDLHDEIGSNLGSISLLSELGARDNEDLAEVNRIARETVESMHDIAWVIQAGYDKLPDLLLKMREVAASMLREIDYTFLLEPESPPVIVLSLDFKRHTLLIFKEALHNILRHAEATAVTVRIGTNQGMFTMEINDNGCGFAEVENASVSRAGLKNMASRATSLGGTIAIHSIKGEGTVVRLSLPMNASRLG